MTTTTQRPDSAPRTDADRPAPRHRRSIPWGRIAAWAVMVIFLLITLFPFYWMLRTALSSNNALATDPASLLPVGLNTGGFERVFGLQDVETAISQGGSGASINFWRYLLNSVIVATTITVVQRLQPSLSFTAETTTSRMEISEVKPAKTSEPKNSTPISTPAGAWEMIVGKATKANPMPEVTTSATSTPFAWAMKPRAEKTPMPQRISKEELVKPTMSPEPVRLVRRLR